MIRIVGDEVQLDGIKVATLASCAPSIAGKFKDWLEEYEDKDTRDRVEVLEENLEDKESELSELKEQIAYAIDEIKEALERLE